MGLPEPPNNSCQENLTINNELIIGSESDSDEEDSHTGYELLPLGPEDDERDDNYSMEDEDDDYRIDDDTEPAATVPPITRAETVIVQEVWSTSQQRPDIVMDTTKVNEVLTAMGNFTLPPQSIPEWANSIPEELWKQRLLEGLQNRQSTSQ